MALKIVPDLFCGAKLWGIGGELFWTVAIADPWWIDPWPQSGMIWPHRCRNSWRAAAWEEDRARLGG
jgi:hypothetical protein